MGLSCSTLTVDVQALSDQILRDVGKVSEEVRPLIPSRESAVKKGFHKIALLDEGTPLLLLKEVCEPWEDVTYLLH